MASFSPSSLDTFETCALQYEFRYVRKVKPPEPRLESIEVFLGSRVHESLEHLHRERSRGTLLSVDELLAYFRGAWEQRMTPQVTVSRADSTAADYFARGETCLRRYYAREHPFDSERTLGLELPVAYALDSEGGVRIRGYIDRLALAGDGCYEVQDYKTSARLPDPARLARDRQLPLYQLGAQQLYPDATPGRVRLVWYFLSHDAKIVLETTAKGQTDLVQRTLGLARRILSTSEFPARVGRWCSFCDYRRICPAYTRMGMTTAT